jgi:Na+-driven multidrug efflux pump
MKVNSIDMTQGKPAPLILKFAFPLIIANLFQQGYGVVDNLNFPYIFLPHSR